MARFGRKTVEDTTTENTDTNTTYDPYNENGPELHDVYPNDVPENTSTPEESPMTSTPNNFAAMSFDDVDALPPRTRKTEENPFTAVVAESLTWDKTKRTPPLAPDQVKGVTALLRRAASDAGHGINIRERDNGDGTVSLYFKSEAEKRSRAYTVVQVREWARDNGYTDADLLPRVASYVSNAYREAHGHKVKKSK